jgi:hypothetical protein
MKKQKILMTIIFLNYTYFKLIKNDLENNLHNSLKNHKK